MNANVSKLLNEQINKEFYSAYLYPCKIGRYVVSPYPVHTTVSN